MPELSKELRDACAQQFGRRNAELHSGEDIFVGLGTSFWLPSYYASCDVLLHSMGKSLSDLFSDPETARAMISSLQDEAAKNVQKDIAKHKKEWDGKNQEEQAAAAAQAIAWETRQSGHRISCPACGNQALIQGSKHGSVTNEYQADFVIQKQSMQPSALECVACRLRITGYSKLLACGRGDAFTLTERRPKPVAKSIREGSKTAMILALLRREQGATAKEMMDATGWQAHSVRGFLSATVAKKLQLTLVSTKDGSGQRTYMISA